MCLGKKYTLLSQPLNLKKILQVYTPRTLRSSFDTRLLTVNHYKWKQQGLQFHPLWASHLELAIWLSASFKLLLLLKKGPKLTFSLNTIYICDSQSFPSVVYMCVWVYVHVCVCVCVCAILMCYCYSIILITFAVVCYLMLMVASLTCSVLNCFLIVMYCALYYWYLSLSELFVSVRCWPLYHVPLLELFTLKTNCKAPWARRKVLEKFSNSY